MRRFQICILPLIPNQFTAHAALTTLTRIGIVGMSLFVDLVSLVSRCALDGLTLTCNKQNPRTDENAFLKSSEVKSACYSLRPSSDFANAFIPSSSLAA